MGLLFDSFWRAVAYCVHPRVMVLSVLPVLLLALVSLALGYFFWDGAVATVTTWLTGFEWVQTFLGWLDRMGLGVLGAVFAPLLVLTLSTPVMVLMCLLLVAMFMTPAMVDLVGQRRFARLERKHGGSLLVSVLWSFGSTFLAVAALLLSLPLWLIPPLMLILPPLIWGWLTYRVFAFDALATHATREERRAILKEHRASLFLMGVLAGYLGAAPSLLWAWGALTIPLMPVLVPVAIWIYTLVFAFASLWFAHYLLSVLERLRATPPVELLDPDPGCVAGGRSLPSENAGAEPDPFALPSPGHQENPS